jgi:hypothetical protein
MGSEKPPEKIGIGPLGRGGGLIQFIVFAGSGLSYSYTASLQN